jgi:serine/threonine protein kinase
MNDSLLIDEKKIWLEKFNDGTVSMIGKYHLDRYLGMGAYGVVFEVSKNNIPYAAKLIDLVNTDDVGYLPDYQEELNIFNKISLSPYCHPYVVCIYDHFVMYGFTQIVGVLILELMQNTLSDVSVTNAEFPVFLQDILGGLVYLHSLRVTHGDLHLGNIFRSLDGHFKMGDFSLGKMNADRTDIREDDWDFGELLLSMVYDYSYEEIRRRGTINIFSDELPSPVIISSIPSNVTEKIIRNLLNPNKNKRWSSAQALDFLQNSI